MGRCYEFGVEIHPGCENTMVVSAEGGACECADCGARCPGRFAGCADVVAVPGRVPLSAPAWSRPGAARRDSPGAPAPEPFASPGRPSKAAPHLGVMKPLPANGGGNGHSGTAAVGADPADLSADLSAVHAGLAELRAMVVSLTEQSAQDRAAMVLPVVDAIDALTKKLLDRDERIGSAFVSFTSRQAELGARIESLASGLASLERVVGDQPGQPSLRQFLGGRRP